MFIYCNNQPVDTADSGGNRPYNVNVGLTDSGKTPEIMKKEFEFREYCRANEIQVYNSAYAAAQAWARENRGLSKEKERMSYIYEEYGLYFYTDVYVGSAQGLIFSANVILPTVLLEINRSAWGGYRVAAQIHSHPDPGFSPSGIPLHNDFPSASPNIYGGDRIAMEQVHYPEMYVVPYKLCPGTPEIIIYTDPSTWCQH